MARLTIGELSRLTGVRATIIRWYEAGGWLPPAARTEGGHRSYGDTHLRRLGFIRHSRELGFSKEHIRSLLDLVGHPGADCSAAHTTAAARIAEVDVTSGSDCSARTPARSPRPVRPCAVGSGVHPAASNRGNRRAW